MEGMEAMQLPLLEIRDQRMKEWFWIDNVFLDRYAKKVGPTATLVYIALSRHADQGTQSCFPSMQTIAEEVGIKSRNTVAKGIKTLEQYGIIDTKENYDFRNGKRKSNTYFLTSRKYWRDALPEKERAPEKQKPTPKQDRLLPVSELPEWLDKKAWASWEQFRKEIRKKLTPITIKAQIAMLEKHRADHVAIIEKSIQNGWTGLFPLKGDKPKSNALPAKEGKYAHLSK